MATCSESATLRAARAGVVGLASIGLSLAASTFISQSSAQAATGSLSPLSPLSAPSFNDARWGSSAADKAALDQRGRNKADADAGSLYTVGNAIGARAVWKQRDSANRQITGQGVTVALLDSGAAAVSGLDGEGKLSLGPDLSIESNGVLIDQDTYGHGTHLAGIIAGRDAAVLTDKTIPGLDPSVQLGIAPDAGLLSMKLATTDGSTDVSQVIAALNWITEHQTNYDGSRVRVVNLSFGTHSVQPYQLDPLAAAAENAWHHGLVVVVSGGNEGPAAGRLTNPAIDPYVIAVGASDSKNTVAGWNVPSVAAFSSGGSVQRHVDLLAPGSSIVSLRAPGSFIDTTHPEGQVAGDTTGRLFRGSGTSQAAAVVSGAAALLLQAYPDLTPDEVKAALVTTASRVPASSVYAGAGQLDVAAALSAVRSADRSTSRTGLENAAAQDFPISTGQGSLDEARGGDSLVDADGVPLTGEIDVQGNPWNAPAWWAASSELSSWVGGDWMGGTWTGSGWASATDSLESARWSSARWSSARWSSARWSSARWSSARWSDADWSSARWSDADWSSARWSSARWSSARWSSARWSSARWSAATWG
ncbi:MAG TPA: S8 family serine peptidase [Jatrophihabitans sp.]|jgi:serine protease AprX|uniref:S8 family serine peptidase n=1 Tax=Jatrophihabitans sp. TaxID=1932789 RepID=UPI002EEF9FA8